MKRLSCLFVVCLILGGASFGSQDCLFADDSDSVIVDNSESDQPVLDEGWDSGNGQITDAIVARFDLDKDGELNASEKATMKETMKAERITRFDTDGDGTLSETEKKAAREAARENRKKEKLNKKMDTNKDGVVSDVEKSAFKEKKKAADLEKFDADGDGKLNESELATKSDAKKAQKEQKKLENLEKYDSDSDGKLNKTERKAKRAKKKEGKKEKKAKTKK